MAAASRPIWSTDIQHERPFFSICIPHHNRASFLIRVLQSIEEQTFRDVEICISDDASTDHSRQAVADFAATTSLGLRVARQAVNVRYDANLRAAISMAEGSYCFLLGNDDALASRDVLERIAGELQQRPAGVVLTNFEDYETGARIVRAPRAGLVAGGPDVAVRQYRNFSFVSGIVFDRNMALQHATAEWDGSEMYQMFTACRIIASGGPLMMLSLSSVRKDVRVPGELVDSYALRPRLDRQAIQAESLPLMQIPRLVFAAVAPYARGRQRSLAFRIVWQLYAFTLPYWIVEYRRVQSLRYALGVALGASVGRVAGTLPLSTFHGLVLRVFYPLITAAAALVPVRAFTRFHRLLHGLAKRVSVIGLRGERCAY
jgi:hypothetical protein